jgi:transmembrane sensor
VSIPKSMPGDLERIDRAAAEWFGRREVGLSAAEEIQFQQWLSQDRRHLEQYQEFDNTWDLLDGLGELKPVEASRAGQGHRKRRWMQTWRLPVGIAAAILLVFTVRHQSVEPEPSPYEVTAESGGMKKLVLLDGSVVRLNADTAVTVSFKKNERRIELQRGEAFFAVVKDPERPFIVTVAGVSVQAVGTAFNVALGSSAIEVLVTEGKVKVEQQAAGRSFLPIRAADTVSVLGAGQKAVLDLRASAPNKLTAAIIDVQPVDAEKAMAWQVKMLQFDSQSLREIVAEFNRYNHHQLVVADVELGERKFGGTFRADNHEALVELLESRFGVAAEGNGSRTILRSRR